MILHFIACSFFKYSMSRCRNNIGNCYFLPPNCSETGANEFFYSHLSTLFWSSRFRSSSSKYDPRRSENCVLISVTFFLGLMTNNCSLVKLFSFPGNLHFFCFRYAFDLLLDFSFKGLPSLAVCLWLSLLVGLSSPRLILSQCDLAVSILDLDSLCCDLSRELDFESLCPMGDVVNILPFRRLVLVWCSAYFSLNNILSLLVLPTARSYRLFLPFADFDLLGSPGKGLSRAGSTHSDLAR